MNTPTEPQKKQAPKVLIVDDEPGVLSLLDRILNRRFIVLKAGNVDEARAIMKKEHITLIFCDHHMPGENGLSFLTNLRKRYPKIQRILFTGDTDASMLLSAINDGKVFQYLVKPPKPEQVLQVALDALAEYERQQNMDHMLEERDELSSEIHSTRFLLKRWAYSASAAMHLSGSVFFVSLVFILILLGIALLGGVLVFAILYILKSGLGFDLFDGHLEDYIRR